MEAKYAKDLRLINEIYQNIHLIEKEKRMSLKTQQLLDNEYQLLIKHMGNV